MNPAGTVNLWDKVSTIFDVESKDKVDPRASDNILIAWPVLLQMLSTVPVNSKILDFGCGTGAFARKLQTCQFKVEGVDPSDNMIAIAKRQSKGIQFTTGSVEAIPSYEVYDAISSVMVLQFISHQDIDAVVKKLVSHLKPHGKLVFAVHSKAYVNYAKDKVTKYFELDGNTHILFKEHGSMQLHLRDPSDYVRIFEAHGLKHLETSCPHFTDEYIQNYCQIANEPLDMPKFTIMSFAKQ